MSTVEVRKAFKIRSCHCRRGYGGRIRVCGHDNGVTETYWIVVVDGQPTGEQYPRMRDALAAAPKETP
jgi:hypothetical protein